MLRMIRVATVGLLLSTCGQTLAMPEVIEVRRIWDQAPHNAFTDLIRYQGQWYCVFREDAKHVSPSGKIRVIRSSDGRRWDSTALLARQGSDLRDAKISITPDGRLMLLAAASWHDPVGRMPMVWFSKDGTTWSEGVEVGEKDYWLWRVTWHKGVARGVGYGVGEQAPQARLYESTDGITYTTLVDKLFDVGRPNESSIVYRDDDTALCLLRRDGTPNTGQLGTSHPPYTKWTWKDLGVRIGGPHMIQIPDGRFVAATRLYDGRARTALSWLNPAAGTLSPFVSLPSGGDTSYPGLVFHDGLLWVSYYSSHEGKTSIYLAKVRLPATE